MNEVGSIRVENVSKVFRIGHAQKPGGTLGDAIRSGAKNLFKRKAYEDFKALDDVSFRVEPGERVGIIGRNGAGKSTLLKILSRITPPTSGTVRLRGRVASLLEVGTGFHPELTGRENIYLNGAILGMSHAEIQRKFDKIVDFSEVEKFLDTPVKRYSSGMYVRLAFAVAAHLETDILLVDEVLAVGDILFQRKCLGKMGELAESGRTLLFVSHNMASVVQLCKRCILLSGGRVAHDGLSDTVAAQYMKAATQSIQNTASRTVASGQEIAKGTASVCDLEILGQDGLPSKSVLSGEPLTLRVRGVAGSDVERLGFAVQVADAGGLNVCYCFDPRVFVIPGMDRQFEFSSRIQLPVLAPGVYYLNTWLGIQDRVTYEYSERFTDIELVQSPAIPLTRRWQREFGLVYSTISIEPIIGSVEQLH